MRQWEYSKRVRPYLEQNLDTLPIIALQTKINPSFFIKKKVIYTHTYIHTYIHIYIYIYIYMGMFLYTYIN